MSLLSFNLKALDRGLTRYTILYSSLDVLANNLPIYYVAATLEKKRNDTLVNNQKSWTKLQELTHTKRENKIYQMQ